MRFPSKVVPVSDSTFAIFVPILKTLADKRYTPLSLYVKMQPKQKRASLPEFLDALTCLYALNKIELDPETGVLSRVS